jgi:hypothetical protein
MERALHKESLFFFSIKDALLQDLSSSNVALMISLPICLLTFFLLFLNAIVCYRIHLEILQTLQSIKSASVVMTCVRKKHFEKRPLCHNNNIALKVGALFGFVSESLQICGFFKCHQFIKSLKRTSNN